MRGPRGPKNELHFCSLTGNMERTVALLSRGTFDVDQGDPNGSTPLMFASTKGHVRVVRALLNKGANVEIAEDGGAAPLHGATKAGHLTITKVLLKAGADLEAKIFTTGSTPLNLAAHEGHSEIISVLIEAGADPNSRRLDGSTSLHCAAQEGHMGAIKLLIRAKANPLLAATPPNGTPPPVPLDIAAGNGRLEVVRLLIQEFGIEGCGGASGGVRALELAAQIQHVEVMAVLTNAGVVDTGKALGAAACFGQELAVKFLLEAWKRNRRGGQGAAHYLDASSCPYGRNALLDSIHGRHPCSSRITRMLVDAGADTASAVRLTDSRGVVAFNDTPLAYTFVVRRWDQMGGKSATERELNSMEAVRRLLMRVEAVHAVSWLWPSDVPSINHAAAEGKSKKTTKATPSPLKSMLPLLRRRAHRPRVFLSALFRNSVKP